MLLGIAAIAVAVVVFTVYVNVRVENAAEGLVFDNVASVPRNRVALLLGTNPRNRRGGLNSYFTN